MILNFKERLAKKQKAETLEKVKEWFNEMFGEESIETKKALIEAMCNGDEDKAWAIAEPIINRKSIKQANQEMQAKGWL